MLWVASSDDLVVFAALQARTDWLSVDETISSRAYWTAFTSRCEYKVVAIAAAMFEYL